MCFSNLPIEFDDEGNPYLADEAEEVEEPGNRDHQSHDHNHDDEVAADTGKAPALDADPEAAYAEIVADVPESVREELVEKHTSESGRDDQRESARGD